MPKRNEGSRERMMSDMRKQLLQKVGAVSVALLGAAVVLGAANEAQAAACSSLPNPVYVAGSSAVKPFLSKVAAELASLSTPITVVYQGQGSCVGVQALTGTVPGTITGTGMVWDTDGAEVSGGCTLSLTGNTVDIGVSDVFAESCSQVIPSDVVDFHGPIQGMTFVVPSSSSQSAISAEAAYLVVGLGADGEVSPWTDETQVQIRSNTSGTQQMISAAIGVPATRWLGTSNAGSGDVIANLAAAATAGDEESAIGILATDVADKNRASVKILAYQHYGQTCGYWPDSAANSFDKQNIRDGHYMIWGPLHMFARVSDGAVENEDAKVIIDYLSGAVEPKGFDLIELEAKSGVVPECAMRVTRAEEVGELTSYMPEKSCECRFVEAATGTAPETCQSCEDDSDCDLATPACNYGFCEVK
jgi:ABC-type phosphate transport system substrate-binding protein